MLMSWRPGSGSAEPCAAITKQAKAMRGNEPLTAFMVALLGATGTLGYLQYAWNTHVFVSRGEVEDYALQVVQTSVTTNIALGACMQTVAAQASSVAFTIRRCISRATR